MRKYIFYLLGIMIVAFVFNGCSANKGKMLRGPTSAQNSATRVSEGSIKYPSVNSSSNSQNLLTENEQMQNDIKSLKKQIHFKFNSSSLEPINEYGISENPINILNNVAEFMLKNPSVKIRVEGNCDERGTEEYNLALGEKRALAAKRYLEAKGINSQRIDTVSFGESQPIDPAHNEEAWAKNRRDHFVFLK